MDSLGSPPAADATPWAHPQWVEAAERLKFLAQQRDVGCVTGPSAVGKSLLLRTVARSLRQAGMLVAELDLTAVQADELPRLWLDRLGLSAGLHAPWEVWTALDDFARSLARTGQALTICCDHLEQLDPHAEPALRRLRQIFSGHASCLFALRPGVAPFADRLAKEFSWLHVELTPPSSRDTAGWARRAYPNLRMAEDFEMPVAPGLSSWRRLSQLVELADAADESPGADIDAWRALQAELDLR